MASSPVKIAFCTDGIFPHKVGGIQRHSRLLIEELATYDHIQITVLHPHETGVFEKFPAVREISISPINYEKTYLPELYRYSKRIYEKLKTLDDHIIYSQGPSVWHKAREFSSRLIINPHGLEPFQAISFEDKTIALPFRIIWRYLFSKARYVVSLGGHLTDILKPLVTNENHLVVLPNAVNKPELNDQKTDKKSDSSVKALFVGRFESNKGIHILMEAIKRLNQTGYKNKIEFNLAGKGPLYEKYKAENKLKNVHILGFVSDEELEELYRTADLFVLPTLFEGMPTVVLEAMSKSIPVIVTDVGATAELVDSSNGFLIEKNRADELQKALVQFLMLSGEEKAALGQNSLAKVRENFTWEKVAQKHKALFKTLQNELQAAE